ncbi:MAG: GNAT family protein [Candidatus Levybacteria bacterium]|nr:GNAT family protein [Candidatus Levybacteria bacterium]
MITIQKLFVSFFFWFSIQKFELYVVKGYNVEGFKFIATPMEEREKRPEEEKILEQELEPETSDTNNKGEEWDFTPVGVWCGIPLLDLLDLATKPIEIGSSNGDIVLNQFSVDDSQEIFELIDSSREYLSQHGDDTAKKYPSLNAVRESILSPSNPNKLRFGIRNKNGVLVGSINLTPDEKNPLTGEVGYYLGASHTEQEYMVEAVKVLTTFAFDQLNYHALYAKVTKANIPSAKTLQKAGYLESERGDEDIIFHKQKE